MAKADINDNFERLKKQMLKKKKAAEIGAGSSAESSTKYSASSSTNISAKTNTKPSTNSSTNSNVKSSTNTIILKKKPKHSDDELLHRSYYIKRKWIKQLDRISNKYNISKSDIVNSALWLWFKYIDEQ